MIPVKLKSHHFESAIQEIDKNGVPKSRESYIYDLLFNGKKYPPKYVISIANMKRVLFTGISALDLSFGTNTQEFSTFELTFVYNELDLEIKVE